MKTIDQHRLLAGPRLPRRSLLQGLGAMAIAAPFLTTLTPLTSSQARAQSAGRARRAIFIAFPDGVPGVSQNGDRSEWHPEGSEHSFSTPRCLELLGSRRDDCVFFSGLSSGGTDSGSHPGGAKKLFTAVDGGNGQSLDQFIAHGVFSSAPWRHLYLGVQATQNNASGDKHVSYPSAGTSIAPEDNPRVAFARLFNGGLVGGGTLPPSSPTPTTTPTGLPSKRRSILDVVGRDLADLRGRLGTTERARLDLHTQSVREVETRLAAMADDPGTGTGTTPPSASCTSPTLAYAVDDASLMDPARFPEIAKAQIDVAVLALSCGITRTVTLQFSHHTSELIMSRFPGTEQSLPNFDMRSHQASHYGASHDDARLEYRQFVLQRRWFVLQLKVLLDELAARPDPEVPGATLLDTTVVLMGSEISDGNTHSHDNLPLILAGHAGGALSTGRLLSFGYERHHKLLTSVARLCGANITGFGDGQGTLNGIG